MVSIISFDLDGTIMQQGFADTVWLIGLPKIYAEEKNLDFETAQTILMTSYEQISSDRREWYDLDYWITSLCLSITPKELLEKYRSHIQLFPDAASVIKSLSNEYTLIISSGAMKEFIDIQLTSTGLNHYFSHMFSSTTDSDMVKKDPLFFKYIAHTLDVRPEEIAHVGDNEIYDYQSPRKAGLHAFYLHREKNHSMPDSSHIVHSLREFEQLVKKLS
ncbi:MAG: HAD family hydrolase [Candidatus Thermoplasmatota archaeon]|nr:HAD family hydrolase [Candidatus Thermoplasmatota archaeon]